MGVEGPSQAKTWGREATKEIIGPPAWGELGRPREIDFHHA